jgi:hypothetical protein
MITFLGPGLPLLFLAADGGSHLSVFLRLPQLKLRVLFMASDFSHEFVFGQFSTRSIAPKNGGTYEGSTGWLWGSNKNSSDYVFHHGRLCIDVLKFHS